MILPLLSRWRIEADTLPPEMMQTESDGFSLPGAQELLSYTGLLGMEDHVPQACTQSAPFPLPAMLPDAAAGRAVLSIKIDFGALDGDRAVLLFDQLTGSGYIRLGEKNVARFSGAGSIAPSISAARALSGFPCQLAVDLSAALHAGRQETLSICFDETRPAGVPGPVFLQTTADAYLSQVFLHADPVNRTAFISARICAQQGGSYALRAQSAPVSPQDPLEPAREITAELAQGEQKTVCMTFDLPAHVVDPQRAFSNGVFKVSLWRSLPGRKDKKTLCDSQTLSCGYPAGAPSAYIPLDAQDIAAPDLAQRLHAIHAPGVSLSRPVPDALLRSFDRTALRARLPADDECSFMRCRPCVSFSDEQEHRDLPGFWRLCGVTGLYRAVPPGFTQADMLHDCIGRPIDACQPDCRETLAALDALSVRLLAEAARQGRAKGALCRPGQWREAAVSAAVQRAFAPVHLSVLPLYGAWWAQSRFSASVQACFPEKHFAVNEVLTAIASLTDENGEEIAQLRAPVRPRGGFVGVLECMLPDRTCRLALRVQLLCGRQIIEEDELPVYVGLNGPLEAAF